MTAPAPAPRDLELPDRRLRLWDHGGAGRPLLLLHGYLDTGRSFDALAAALAPDWRALCLDWRGHGASARVPASASYHQLDHLKDLVLVLDHLAELGLAPAALIGHSMGAILALLLAGTMPARVTRLVLIEALGALPATPEEQVERLSRALAAASQPPPPFRSYASPADAIARLRENNAGLGADGAARMLEPVLARRADGRWELPFDPRLRGPSPVRFPEDFWLALCRRVRAATLVVAGESGHLRDFAALSGRLAALGDPPFVTIPGASHHVHVDAPAALADALAAFSGS